MKSEHIRITAGFIIAPLFGPISAVFLIVLFGNSPNYHFELKSFMNEIFGLLYLFLLFGAPIAYLVTSLIGIPFFMLCHKFNFINFWSIVLGSTGAPLLPLLILHIYNGYIYEDPSKSAADLYLFMSACGLIVGIAFWFISGLGKKAYNNSSNLTGAENAPPS